MPKAIEQIVDAYVRLGDREALEDLMAHRQKLAVDLKSRTDFDFSLAIGQIDDDIAVIEAGVEKLRAAESSSG
jgi:capsule polysaccharide export protein KpsE/RkpR